MIKQRTLKNIVCTTGIGLHTGQEVTLTLYPALANTGIIYRRIDLNPPVDFCVNIESVGSTFLCTCLKNNTYGVQVLTVEHLSAAQSGLGIDNIIIELNGPEVPIMDGSADPFVSLLLNAGIKELNSSKNFFRLKQIVRVEDGDRWAELRPFNGFTLDFTIDYDHPVVNMKNKHYFFNFTSKSFRSEISSARTFGFVDNIQKLKNCGFVLGGSLTSSVVMDKYQVVNSEGLRFNNELVRHKILDAVGDLFMCGYNLIGSFIGFKSGHTLNNKLLRAVLARRKAWEITSCIQGCDVSKIF